MDRPTYNTPCPHGLMAAVYCARCMSQFKSEEAAADQDQPDLEELEEANRALIEQRDALELANSILEGELAQAGQTIERLEDSLAKLRAQIFKSGGGSVEDQRRGGFARWFGGRR